MRKMLWGLTGSVASIKHEDIKKEFINDQVFVLFTEKSKHFAIVESIDTVQQVVEYMNKKEPFWIGIKESAEWEWLRRNDLVLHIELRKWAEMFVIIPCSANSLGKIINGLCDCLLLSVARAWDYKLPFIICPCMNTLMYHHPITNEQLEKFKSWGGNVIYPVEKLLACGDYGTGALPKIEDIVQRINDF